MSNGSVLDASALLCLLNQEPGFERVEASIAGAAISAVNFSEVVAKLVERGGTVRSVSATLAALHLDLVDFDLEQALLAGDLRADTRPFGLSFGDRACLALAMVRKAKVLTTDRSWGGLRIGATIELVR